MSDSPDIVTVPVVTPVTPNQTVMAMFEGTKGWVIIFGAFALIGLAIVRFSPHTDVVTPTPVVPVVPVPVAPADVLQTAVNAAMVGPNAKADAAYLSVAVSALADRVGSDVGEDAVLTKRSEVAYLVHNMGKIASAGRLKGVYPNLKVAVALSFEPFPKDVGDLSEADRAVAVTCLRDLSKALTKVK